MKIVFFILMILLVSYSCDDYVEPDKITQIKIEELQDTENISISIDKVVPLETEDESVFGQFYKLTINESGIYILDRIFTRNLYHFDGNGRYINKLQTGKGPGEILHPYSMYIDNQTGETFVYDAGNDRISVVDLDLNYLRTIPVTTNIAYHHFNRLPNKKWLVQANYKNPIEDTTALYVLLDQEFQRIEQKYISFDPNFESVSTLAPISTDSYNNPLFAGVYDNNLYTIDSRNNLQIKYQVDFGDYNLTEEELETDDYTTITKLWQNGKRKTYLDHIHESVDYVGFTYWFIDRMEFCIYSKPTKNILCSEYIEDNDFIMGTLVGLTDDYFVLAAEPNEVIEYFERSELEGNQFNDLEVEESDNPVLIYYQLSEIL